MRQVECFLLYMIQQTSGCCDQDIHPAFQAGDLWIDVDSADHDHRT